MNVQRMPKGRHQIGPNCDLKLAAMTMATYLLQTETGLRDSWGKLTGQKTREYRKAQKRVEACERLVELARADLDGRLILSRVVGYTKPSPDASKSPTDASGEPKTTYTATEPSTGGGTLPGLPVCLTCGDAYVARDDDPSSPSGYCGSSCELYATSNEGWDKALRIWDKALRTTIRAQTGVDPTNLRGSGY